MDQSQRYYVPHGSYWPIVGAVGLFFMMLGLSSWLNGVGLMGWVAWLGVAIVLVMICGWFATVINESETGMYSGQVDRSFRMGMTWFIISEVMFFAAFFGALFYARQLAIPWLGGAGNNFFTHLLLFPGIRSRLADPGGPRRGAVTSRSWARAACRRSTPRSC
jgi:cytochrome c oxidase subunit III